MKNNSSGIEMSNEETEMFTKMAEIIEVPYSNIAEGYIAYNKMDKLERFQEALITRLQLDFTKTLIGGYKAMFIGALLGLIVANLM